jgi:hypothetical protein
MRSGSRAYRWAFSILPIILEFMKLRSLIRVTAADPIAVLVEKLQSSCDAFRVSARVNSSKMQKGAPVDHPSSGAPSTRFAYQNLGHGHLL